MLRIGQSTDIHPLRIGRDMVLGGVLIESDLGPDGHSDADVLTHAIAEAMLGALALGDLGKHFPDTDPRYKGISSILLLQEVVLKVESLGWHLVNVDSLVLLEAPKLAKYNDAIRINLANALHVSVDQVSVKATRGEKLGFIGRGEGIAAQAVVLLEKNG
ncbi:MAG: 2-C-methyl-D-erythritol 2,4-cyclodiphosphate synthase [Firmicutes bacterium GWF2_51_9]|nr:MAG: 2-C-methyl-D-erythritol 2,4-cyclodiphosphate synthase [Firmicutes bacterium GWF2_51_9]OGS58183.1 MAG: 2-C-methyl-D-erythritol 2,4-cyclodiphosphate synthase [Firmicutes bacterium GWE2_51_13]HAM63562.1 2-C-methyl-D-erythritol 2,4-cyclodiphosphate synthase [Erysipelotrichaceae bacterium]HAO60914.1 2-C-methyl-D-erythritol 2,4-cyclodiphosphate synthase [Erysipelotrichaceae bacterium]HBZ42160.1 2-C-methyl-D-erythritol 2,4-cyclodiphosphate synthase [Erysipelotrichaceae bacterium]